MNENERKNYSVALFLLAGFCYLISISQFIFPPSFSSSPLDTGFFRNFIIVFFTTFVGSIFFISGILLIKD